jgi:precorrin-6B methylase 2
MGATMKTSMQLASIGCVVLTAAGGLVLQAQVRDPLTLPHEVRLNQRQPPEFVLKTIGIRPGMVVGEIGAGGGRYTVQIASRIRPGGRLYANDIDRAALESLRRRSTDLGFTHVEIVVGTVTETRLPRKTLDLIVMVNVVHCLADPVALLKAAAVALKPGGRVAIVEGNLDKNPGAAGEWFPRAKLLGIFEGAGYALVREDASLPQDNIYLLEPRSPAGD